MDLGTWQPKGCAAQSFIWEKTVASGLLLLYLQDPLWFHAGSCSLLTTPAHDWAQQGHGARPLLPSGRLLVGHLCSLVPHQPGRGFLRPAGQTLSQLSFLSLSRITSNGPRTALFSHSAPGQFSLQRPQSPFPTFFIVLKNRLLFFFLLPIINQRELP